MANSYYDLSKLSKIQLPGVPGGGTYRLQDNDLRQMAYSTAYAIDQAYDKNKIVYVADEDALYIANSNITAAQNTDLQAFKALATEISLADALLSVYNQLSAIIAGGTHFIGKTTTTLTDHATTNPITIDGNEVTAIQGDIVIYNNGTIDIEFIFDGTYWNEFGTAGLLKALAFADSASATYTPVGTITVAEFTQTPTNATLTTADYTPAGTIEVTGTDSTISVLDVAGTVTAGVAPTFAEGAFVPNQPTQLDLTKFNGGAYTAATFTAGELPTKAADTFDAGALPSLGEASVGQFAFEGLKATVDTETLVFSLAGTTAALTSQGAFNAGSLPTFTEGAFTQGALPTFTDGSFTAATFTEGFYTPGTTASKASDTFNAGSATEVTLPTFQEVTVLSGATATFTGTKAENILVTGVAYDRATSAGASFTGTAATITVTPTVTE